MAEGEWCDEFMKDKGGASNSLGLHNLMIDSKTKRSYKVKLTLIYGPGGDLQAQAVPNQKILEVHNAEWTERRYMEVSSNTVFSVIFRINDVSKNHGKQPFCLLVESVEEDLVPFCSKHVTVKSKVNKQKTPEPVVGKKTKIEEAIERETVVEDEAKQRERSEERRKKEEERREKRKRDKAALKAEKRVGLLLWLRF